MTLICISKSIFEWILKNPKAKKCFKKSSKGKKMNSGPQGLAFLANDRRFSKAALAAVGRLGSASLV